MSKMTLTDVRELIDDIDDDLRLNSVLTTFLTDTVDKDMVMLLLMLGFAELNKNPKILDGFNGARI